MPEIRFGKREQGKKRLTISLSPSILTSPESRAKVDEMVAAGAATCNDPQHHGFMYGQGFQVLDGHIRELIYREPWAVNQVQASA